MTITITQLNKRELECADHLIYLLEKMGKLNHESRQKVYERWMQLHLINVFEAQRFESIVRRVNAKT